jgi:hypothetical protein
MARHEADKEDLIAEASALVDRFEFVNRAETAADTDKGQEPGDAASVEPSDTEASAFENQSHVVAGFRRDASFSIYFGQNPFYQFTPQHRLRRAWEDGYLFRSQGHTLARLDRQRGPTGTVLQRTDLTAAELEGFFDRMRNHLDRFIRCIDTGELTLQRAVAGTQRTTTDVVNCVAQIQQIQHDFLAPAVGVR